MNKNKKHQIFFVAILITMLITACATTAEDDSTAGVLQGVFTADQAQSGRNTFTSVCRTCHIPRDFRTILKQSDNTEALLIDYYNLISSTMPQDSPGSLTEQTYLEVMAYLLSINGFPASPN